MAESLAEFFLTHFRTHSSDRAYGQRRGYRTEWFTYRQILDMALNLSGELTRRGVVKGEHVMLWAENSAQWIAAFFACTLRGLVVVPMDDTASSDFTARVAHQVEAKLWLCSRPHAQHIQADKLILEDLSQNLTTKPPNPAIPLTRDDTLQIVFTSGATADPKGVIITHGNVLANIAPLEREMQPYLKYERLVHPIRFLNLLPLSHVFGQFLAMFLPPLLGGTVIFQDALRPSEIIQTIHRERVSVLVSVPRVLQSLKNKIEKDLELSGQLDSFRQQFRSSANKHFLLRWWSFRKIRRQFGWKFWAFISGGAALDSETEEFWGRLGYAAIQGYGLTETTSLISVNHPFKLSKGSIGKILPGRDVKLADDGEILIRGEGVAAGYFQNGRQAKVADNEGWYRTGDVGALDASGNLYFKGRKKEVIVTPAGLNIHPEDLESALRQQPEVKDCVVVAIDRGGNSEPCAVIIPHEKANLSEVVERANQSLAEFQRMHLWLTWPDPDFPRTSTQKPRRNLIHDFAAKQLLGSAPAPVPAQTENNSILDLIARITGKNTSQFNSQTSLDSDLGLSSLDRVELAGALEDRFQVDLGETRFTSARTVADLELMLAGRSAVGVAYHYPAWALRWPITWLRWLAHYSLVRPAMLLLGWPRIVGRENLAKENGPLLVICNHVTDIDLGFVQTALPARFRDHLATATGGEALEALRTPVRERNLLLKIYDRTKWALGVSLLNLFPLPRQAGFRHSFSYAGAAVDRGYNILVFPEGRITTDGKMNPFRPGIGLLATNLSIPVLPMRVDGLFEIKRAGRNFAPPRAITVRIGKPTSFAPGTPPEQIAVELQERVASL